MPLSSIKKGNDTVSAGVQSPDGITICEDCEVTDMKKQAEPASGPQQDLRAALELCQW